MVIARVAYGKSVDSVQQELSTFRIAEVQASQQRSIATRQATIDLHTQSQNIIGDLQAGGDLQAIEESDAHKMLFGPPTSMFSCFPEDTGLKY
ncbi:hypothetical protein L218DRAFT_1006426 [Marasmius fiardii PR-910]|nr:hypothetical protein L218DRAFT_1006426 [Marasmius fiardii PR-910]